MFLPLDAKLLGVFRTQLALSPFYALNKLLGYKVLDIIDDISYCEAWTIQVPLFLLLVSFVLSLNYLADM